MHHHSAAQHARRPPRRPPQRAPPGRRRHTAGPAAHVKVLRGEWPQQEGERVFGGPSKVVRSLGCCGVIGLAAVVV